jgi:hypothetical protein
MFSIKSIVTGLTKVVNDLKSVSHIKDTPRYRRTIVHIGDQAEAYWKQNVYNYFDARTNLGLSNTGNLGRSISVREDRNTIEFSMAKIYSDGGTEYGHYLREGTGPSLGAYSFRFDRRIARGIHGGYDASTRWTPWMNDYRSYIQRIAVRDFRQIIVNWKREKGYE